MLNTQETQMVLTDKVHIELSVGELIAIGTYIEDRIEKEFGRTPSKQDILDLMTKSLEACEEADIKDETTLLAAVSANLTMKRALVTKIEQEKLDAEKIKAHA